MCSTDTASTRLDQNAVIEALLSVSRSFLGAGGPPAGGHEVVLESTLAKAAACCALAALIQLSTGRAIPSRNSSSATGYANRAQADNAQTTHEVSRLLNRRVAARWVNLSTAEAALEV